MTDRRSILRMAATVGPAMMAGGPSLRALTGWLEGQTLPAASAAGNEDFWRPVQEAFAVDRTIVNLNNGGVSPSPRTVQDAMRRYIEQANMLPAYELWRTQQPRIETVRQGLATMFGTDTEEIAITRNASESLQTLQFGLTLRAGDEVVTTKQDYPRMLTTWEQRVRRDGVVLRTVTYDVPVMRPEAVVEAFEAALTERTRVLHVSHVVFLTGQIMPVARITALARSRGITCIVDGAHSFAQFPFRRQDLGCDFFGTSLHKWLCGPIGTGMLSVARERIADVWPLMAAPPSMDTSIRKFEEIGTHPAAIHNALVEAISFNQALGLDRKAARFDALHERWTSRLRRYDHVRFMTNVDEASNQCAIRLVHIDGVDPEALSDWLLEKHRIFTVAIVHETVKGVRVAPNVYTTMDEIDRFADAMEQVARGDVPSVRTTKQ